jgi:hypothetical protein
VAGDQRAGGRHADEDRAGPGADRGARLLAERRVRLVADHDRVRARDLARVAHEPLVGLDRDGAVGAILVPKQRRRDALAVAAVAKLAEELVDEVAPVRQDQHAAGARGLHEPERRDRLAGARRMLEPEALRGVGILRLLGELLLVGGQLGVLLVPVGERGLGFGAVELGLELRGHVLDLFVLVVGLVRRGAVEVVVVLVVVVERRLVLLEVLLLEVGLLGQLTGIVGGLVVLDAEDRGAGQHVDRSVPVRSAHRLGQQRGQRARQGVDLVGRERGAVRQLGLLLREHALEAEQQRELAPPRGRGDLQSGIELGQRLVERATARRPRRERDRRVLAGVHERLARERLGARNVVIAGKGHSGHCGWFGHRGSAAARRRSRWRARRDSAVRV